MRQTKPKDRTQLDSRTQRESSRRPQFTSSILRIALRRSRLAKTTVSGAPFSSPGPDSPLGAGKGLSMRKLKLKLTVDLLNSSPATRTKLTSSDLARDNYAPSKQQILVENIRHDVAINNERVLREEGSLGRERG